MAAQVVISSDWAIDIVPPYWGVSSLTTGSCVGASVGAEVGAVGVEVAGVAEVAGVVCVVGVVGVVVEPQAVITSDNTIRQLTTTHKISLFTLPPPFI